MIPVMKGVKWSDAAKLAAGAAAVGSAAYLGREVCRTSVDGPTTDGLREVAPMDLLLVGSPYFQRFAQFGTPDHKETIGEDMVTLAVTAVLKGHVTQQQVESAVAALLQSHQCLRLSYDDTGAGRPGWRPIPDLDRPDGDFAGWAKRLTSVVDRKGPAQWKEVMARETNAGFPDYRGRPLFRVVLLQGPAEAELVVAYAHAIGDGVASHTFVHWLLQFIGGKPPLQFPGRRHLDARHCMGTKSPFEKFLSVMLQPIIRRELQKKETHLPDHKAGRRAAAGMKAAFVWRRTETGRLREVLAKAKQEGVRMHAICLAAEIFALSPAVFGAGRKESASWHYMFPAGMRGREQNCGVGKEDIANVSCMAEFTIGARTDTAFWDLAREIQAKTEKAMPDQRMSLICFDRLLDTQADEMVSVLADDTTFGDIMVSNLGAFTFPATAGDVSLQDLYFFQHIPWAATRGFMVFPMSVGGTGTFSFQYTPWLLTERQANALADAYMELFEGIVDMAGKGPTVAEFARKKSSPLLLRTEE